MIRMVATGAPPFKPKLIYDEVNACGKKLLGMIRKDFEATVNGCKHKVEFKTKLTVTRNRITVEVTTTDKIYTYVVLGTHHPAREAKPGEVLVFQEGYTASTKPRIIKSKSSRTYGAQIFTTKIKEFDIEARKFDMVIKEKYAKIIPKEFEAAINRGIKRTGYGR